MPWIGDDKDAANSVFPGLSLVQWMNMQQNNNIPLAQPGFSMTTSNDQSKLLSFQTSVASAPLSQFNKANQSSQVGQFQQPTFGWSQQPPQQQFPQQPALVNNGINQISKLNTQQPVAYSQLQQQLVVADNTQSQQNIQNSFHFSSLPQESQIQQQMEHQPSFLKRHQQPQMQLYQSPLQFLQQNMLSHRPEQPSQQSLAEQQIQVMLMQKLQQQRQQEEQPQPPPPHQHSQQHQVQQQMLLKQQVHQHQHQKLNENSSSTSSFMKPLQFATNQLQSPYRPVAANRVQSGLTDGDAPSCSTSPSTNNCHSSTSNFLNRNPKGPTMLSRDASVEFPSNLGRELKNTPDTRVPNQLKCKGAFTDQLEGSSSATSYCFDAGSLQQSLSVMDGDVQSNQQINFPYEVNANGLTPDTMLSRGYNSAKDLQNIISNYGNNPQDFETDFSSAAINTQSFGVPDLAFKAGCPSDVAMNDTGVLSGAIWANQAQRLRTYTKVQKRGSVGRSIDVTRYSGYDELRQDLAHMFGIEGQLDDPQRTDWKLVYVDHENDVLLVGDDPWDEFVSCVQSIKILSSVEVQQMSLDGDLGHATITTNQACSGTDSGNIWKGNYDDHSAT